MNIERAIQQSSFSSVQQKLHINLMYTYSWVSNHQSRFFKRFKLTAPQYNILRILRGQKGEAIGILGITERMIDPNSNVSRLVEKLRQKALITRDICSTDRRSSEIRITDLGLSLLSEIDTEIASFTLSIGGSLTSEEMEQLSMLLDKMRTQKQV